MIVFTIGIVYTIIGTVALVQWNGSSAGRGQVDVRPFIAFLIVGLALMILTVFPLISGIIAFRARASIEKERPSKGIHIASIVFGGLSSSPFLIGGAVISLVQINYWERKGKPLDDGLE